MANRDAYDWYCFLALTQRRSKPFSRMNEVECDCEMFLKREEEVEHIKTEESQETPIVPV